MKRYLGTFYGKNLYVEATKEEADIFAKRMSNIFHYYPPTSFLGKIKWLLTKQK